MKSDNDVLNCYGWLRKYWRELIYGIDIPNKIVDILRSQKVCGEFMNRILTPFLTLVCFALLTASCTKDDPTGPIPVPGPPEFSGQWSGTIDAIGAPVAFSVTDADGVIHGSGYVGTIAVAVNGEKKYPNLKFSFSSTGFQPAVFEGKFTTLTTVTGSINGSGFVSTSVVLTKN